MDSSPKSTELPFATSVWTRCLCDGAMLTMDEPGHQNCYWFFRSLYGADAATWVVSGFELHTVIGPIEREAVVPSAQPHAGRGALTETLKWGVRRVSFGACLASSQQVRVHLTRAGVDASCDDPAILVYPFSGCQSYPGRYPGADHGVKITHHAVLI